MVTNEMAAIHRKILMAMGHDRPQNPINTEQVYDAIDRFIDCVEQMRSTNIEFAHEIDDLKLRLSVGAR